MYLFPEMFSSIIFPFAVETEFLRKRQVAWDDSFQSLYYMLRNGTCDIFYGNYSCLYIMFFQATFAYVLTIYVLLFGRITIIDCELFLSPEVPILLGVGIHMYSVLFNLQRLISPSVLW